MTDEQAKNFAFNPFDLTKVWPEADYPLIEVGHFELNRNPGNDFAGRAGGILTGQHRTGHRLFARQEAAGASSRRQPPSDSR
jgi:hypothetical protein